MSPNLEQVTAESISQIMAWLQASVETGGHFVAEQAPLVAWEIVAFGRAVHSFSVFMSLVCIVCGIFLLTVLRNNINKACELNTDGSEAAFGKCLLSGFGGCTLCLFGGLTLSAASRDFFLAWFAPRLYIIEYITNLL